MKTKVRNPKAGDKKTMTDNAIATIPTTMNKPRTQSGRTFPTRARQVLWCQKTYGLSLEHLLRRNVLKSQHELVWLLQKQIQIEEEIVKSVNQSLEELVNPAVKATLRARDVEKDFNQTSSKILLISGITMNAICTRCKSGR